MSESEDTSPGASTPRLEPLVTYGGPDNVSGHAASVAKIHRTNRLFDLLNTITIAVLISAVSALTTALAIFAPGDRGGLIWAIAVVSWILAIGLGGFTVFQIRVSPTGIQLSGGDSAQTSQQTAPHKSQRAAP